MFQKNIPSVVPATGEWIARSHAGQLLICSFSPHMYWAAELCCAIIPCSREEGAGEAAECKESFLQPPSPVFKVFTFAPIVTKERKIYQLIYQPTTTHTGRAAKPSPGSWLTLNLSTLSRHTASGSAVTAASRWTRPSCQDYFGLYAQGSLVTSRAFGFFCPLNNTIVLIC